eukprot:7384128-Prymnesium_polylepis.1
MALTGRVREPRSARHHSTPASLPPLQNDRSRGTSVSDLGSQHRLLALTTAFLHLDGRERPTI